MKLVSSTYFSTFHDSPSWERTHELVGEFVGFSRSFDVQANGDGKGARFEYPTAKWIEMMRDREANKNLVEDG